MIDFNIKIFNKLSDRPAMDIPVKLTILFSITAFGFNFKTFFSLLGKSKSHSMIRGNKPVKCSMFKKSPSSSIPRFNFKATVHYNLDKL